MPPWSRRPRSSAPPHVVPSGREPVTLAETPKRQLPGMSAIGVSGVVQYGGIIYSEDYDRAWQGEEADRTIRRMLNDPVIGAAILGAEMIIRRVAWRVDPADDSDEAEEVAEFVTSCLSDMTGFWPGDTMARILTYLGWGWSVLSVGYKQRTGRDGDPPSQYNDGLIGWDSWNLIPQQTRGGWKFDDRGRVTGLVQLDPASFKEHVIPIERCLHFRFGNRTNSPEGLTPLRTAFDAWYRKNRIQVIEGIGIERDLAGLPLMRIPGADIQARNEVFSAAQQIVTSIRQDAQAGLVLSSDKDDSGNYYQEFDLVNSGGGRSINTDTIIRRYANEIVTVFLANVLRTGQDSVGAYSLAETQSGLMQLGLGAQLDVIGDVINSQELPRLMALNGFKPELQPVINHDNIENADLAKLGTYLGALASAGILIDTPELRVFVHDVAGIPVPPVDELKADMERQQKEAEAAAKAEEARRQAELEAAAEQARRNDDDPAQTEKPERPVTVTATERALDSEVLEFVSPRGELTLGDIVKIKEWWDGVVPEQFKGLLEATVVQPGAE